MLWMQVLNVSEELSLGIFHILSAILWIGNLQFTDSESEACQLTKQDEQIIKKLAALLGIPEAHVRKCCTVRQISVKGTTTDIALKFHEVRIGFQCRPTVVLLYSYLCDRDVTTFQAKENRHAMSKALYSRTFSWLVHQINTSTSPGSDNSKFIGVLDIFGFENLSLIHI